MKAGKWLFLAALFTEVTGLAMVLGALLPGTLDPLASLAFGEAVAVDRVGRLGLGIAGALMVGWASSIALLVRSLAALTPQALGTAIAVGVVAWFLLDGLVSIVNGAALNLVGNLLYLAILLAPALALRSTGGVRQMAQNLRR